MSSLYTCPSSSFQTNTGVGRACNCATNDSQPAASMDQPCCAKAFPIRDNTSACCVPKPTNEVIFVCGTGGVLTPTLTIAEVRLGLIYVGMVFTFDGVLNNIVAFGTGSGGAGTYTINQQVIPDGSVITSTNNNAAVPLLNSIRNAYITDTKFWGTLAFPGATNIKRRDPLYPTPESARIAKKLDTYKRVGGTCGFYTNGIPFIPPGCPPTPTAILNASLPKPSTREPCGPARFEGVRNECDE
jgi:hypothetical protein